ncbi:Hypothetical predicted protein [Xyrichtys novacula]|uniref:Uncharacterized protein n=1 Tax=Xyrichtys novacula TaxID=13765 RepID=A0AAV1F180_XYRNO|nr:Hypothetical predicted protein [Xyrichtys novacula]
MLLQSRRDKITPSVVVPLLSLALDSSRKGRNYTTQALHLGHRDEAVEREERDISTNSEELVASFVKTAANSCGHSSRAYTPLSRGAPTS